MIKHKKKNVVAIIQARMGSKRLPNKMMLHLHGKPIINWVVDRSSRSKLIDQLVVAIPSSKENDILEHYLNMLNVNIFRGSEVDLVGRYYEASILYKATHIVRICADRPLISNQEIDNLIYFFLNNDYDYAYNHYPINNKYPIGFGAEITTMDVLEMIYLKSSDPSDREHLFNYILNKNNDFKIGTFDPHDQRIRRPELKFDIDDYDDYHRLLEVDYDMNMTPHQIINIKDKFQNET
jgi:spore coat polysaccharide biosynthesis protein SpsF